MATIFMVIGALGGGILLGALLADFGLKKRHESYMREVFTKILSETSEDENPVLILRRSPAFLRWLKGDG